MKRLRDGDDEEEQDDDDDDDFDFLLNLHDNNHSQQNPSSSSSSSSSSSLNDSELLLEEGEISRVGTITSLNELILPSGEKRKYYCKKHEDLELKLKDCITSKCPLKIHKHQNIEQDADYLDDNCHLMKQNCFCKKIDESKYFDIIGTCAECRQDYHICPAVRCYEAVNLSVHLKDNSKNTLAQFNDHLRLKHNKLPKKSTKPIFNVTNSSDPGIVLNINKEAIINSTIANSSPTHQVLAKAKSYLLGCGDEVIPALKNLIGDELNQVSSNSVQDPGIVYQILLIEDKMLQNEASKNDVLAEIFRVQERIKRKYCDVDASKNFSKVSEYYDEANNKIGAIQSLEEIRNMIESVDPPIFATVAVKINAPSSRSLSSNQSQMIHISKADGMSEDVQKGCLIFFLFYNIDRLYHLMTKAGDDFIPGKLPIRFVDNLKNEYEQEFDVIDMQVIIPLDGNMEKKLISEGLISNGNRELSCEVNIRWCYLNTESEVNMTSVAAGTITAQNELVTFISDSQNNLVGLEAGANISQNELILSNGRKKKFYCKNCKKEDRVVELNLSPCDALGCPLQKHKEQNISDDLKYLQKNCHIKGDICFCKSFNENNYFDIIGTCKGCNKDYHICPVQECLGAFLVSRSRGSVKESWFADFNDHLRNTHNNLESARKKKMIGKTSNLNQDKLQSPMSIQNGLKASITVSSSASASSPGNNYRKRRFDRHGSSTSNSSDLSDFNFKDVFELNPGGIINTTPVASSHANDILQKAISYLLMPQPDIAQVLQLLNEVMLISHYSNDGEDESISTLLLKIERELLSKDAEIDKIIEKVSLIEIRIDEIHSGLDITQEIKDIKKSLLKNNDKIEAIKYLEYLREKVEKIEEVNKKRRFDNDDCDLNPDGIINTIQVPSSHINDILQKAISYLLMPQPDIAQVLQLLNEVMLISHYYLHINHR